LWLPEARQLSTTALSYARIAGANERISLGHIGIGNRGRELDGIVAYSKDKKKRGSDGRLRLMGYNREQALPPTKVFRQNAPLASTSARATGPKGCGRGDDFHSRASHSPLLQMTSEAGKDAYCEKPMGKCLKSQSGARCSRCPESHRPDWHQHRSEPISDCRPPIWVLSGVLGEVTKVRIEWNYHGPRWAGRTEVKMIANRIRTGMLAVNKPHRPF